MIPLRDNIPSRTAPVLTVGLIIVNVLVFLYETSIPASRLEAFVHRYGVVPARLQQVGRDSAVSVTRAVLPVFTSMFLHGGWMHLLGNMWYLWIFGDNIEDRLGKVRFLLLYFLSGLVATGAHVWSAPGSTVPTIGASGAIAGVLGAYLVTYPYARVKTLVPLFMFITFVDLPAILVLGFWFVVQLFNGMASLGARFSGAQGGVAWWAHIGGFVAGIVLVRLLARRRAKRPLKPIVVWRA